MKDFFCPECGSRDGGEELLLSKEMNEKSKDPWDSVLQQIECSSCGSVNTSKFGHSQSWKYKKEKKRSYYW